MTPAIDSLRRLAFCVLATAASASLAAGDDAQARHWLNRVSAAASSLNYDGTFVYRNGDSIESMRIIHRAGAGGSQARLLSLSGEAREVIRDADRVTCFLPDSGSVMVNKARPKPVGGFSVFNPRGDVSEHYDLQLASGERVAGRSTRLVTVMPRDEWRYGYRLFVDEQSGFLLKSELVDGEGSVLEQIVFTRLELPEFIADELLRPGMSGEGFTWYTSPGPDATPRDSTWSVGWLPAGFAMSDRATDPAGAGRMPVEHLVYTDGLASVSVFIEHLDAQGERLEGLSRMGAVNAYGTMVAGFQVTAVGEVPGGTVERIGRSVARR
jgi:sigma-E factor negative regulatory protein RseB